MSRTQMSKHSGYCCSILGRTLCLSWDEQDGGEGSWGNSFLLRARGRADWGQYSTTPRETMTLPSTQNHFARHPICQSPRSQSCSPHQPASPHLPEKRVVLDIVGESAMLKQPDPVATHC